MKQFIFTFFLCVVFGEVWGQEKDTLTFNEFQRTDMPAVVTNSNCQSSVANTATIDLANGNIHVDASIFRGKKGNDNLKMTINAKNTNNVLSILKEGNVKPEGKVQLDYNFCLSHPKDTKTTDTTPVYFWTTITAGVGTGSYTAFDTVARKNAVAFTDTSGLTGKIGIGIYRGWKTKSDKYYCLGIQSAFESTNNIQDLPVLNVEYTTGNDSVKVTESKYARKGSFQVFNQLSARVDFLANFGGDNDARYALNIFAIGAQRFYANSTNDRFVVSPGFAFFIPLKEKKEDKEDKNKIVHIGVQFMTKDIFGNKATNTQIGQRSQIDLVVGIPLFREAKKELEKKLKSQKEEKEKKEKKEKEKLEKKK